MLLESLIIFMALFFHFLKKVTLSLYFQATCSPCSACNKSFSGPKKKKKKVHDLLGLFDVFLILYIAKVVNIDNLRDLSLVHVPDRSWENKNLQIITISKQYEDST